MNSDNFTNEGFPSVWSVVQSVIEWLVAVRGVSGVVTWVNNLRSGFLTAFGTNDSAVVCEDNVGFFAGARHICNNKLKWFLSEYFPPFCHAFFKKRNDIGCSEQGWNGSCRYRGSTEGIGIYGHLLSGPCTGLHERVRTGDI